LSLGRVFAKTRGTTQIPEAATSDPSWATAREWSRTCHRPPASHLFTGSLSTAQTGLPVSVSAEW